METPQRRGRGRPSKTGSAKQSKSSQLPPAPIQETKKDTPFTPASKRVAVRIIESLKKRPHADLFFRPVDPVADDVPDYYEHITAPMDLGTVASRLEGSEYSTVEGFVRDVMLVFKNAMVYNGEGHPVFEIARKFQESFIDEALPTLSPYCKVDELLPGRRRKRESSSVMTPAAAPSTKRARVEKTAKEEEERTPRKKQKQPEVHTEAPAESSGKHRRTSKGEAKEQSALEQPENKSKESLESKRPDSASILKTLQGLKGKKRRDFLRSLCPPPNRLSSSREKGSRDAERTVTEGLSELRKDEAYAIFAVPVDPIEHDCEDYFETIDNPMDLEEVRRRLNTDQYTSCVSALQDTALVFDNAIEVNPQDHPVHKEAIRLRDAFAAFLLSRDKSLYDSFIGLCRKSIHTDGMVESKEESRPAKKQKTSSEESSEDKKPSSSEKKDAKSMVADEMKSAEQKSAVVEGHKTKRPEEPVKTPSEKPQDASKGVVSKPEEPVSRASATKPMVKVKTTTSQVCATKGSPWSIEADRTMDKMFKLLKSHTVYSVFENDMPKDDARYEEYVDTVTHPVCFNSIKQKWEDEEYATVEDAMADFELVFSNALLYYRGREDPESMTKIRGALLLKEFYVTSCSGLWRTLNPSNPPSPEKKLVELVGEEGVRARAEAEKALASHIQPIASKQTHRRQTIQPGRAEISQSRGEVHLSDDDDASLGFPVAVVRRPPSVSKADVKHVPAGPKLEGEGGVVESAAKQPTRESVAEAARDLEDERSIAEIVSQRMEQHADKKGDKAAEDQTSQEAASEETPPPLLSSEELRSSVVEAAHVLCSLSSFVGPLAAYLPAEEFRSLPIIKRLQKRMHEVCLAAGPEPLATSEGLRRTKEKLVH